MRKLSEEERIKRRRARDRSYYARVDRDRKLAAVKAYQAKDPERHRAQQNEWRKANPHRVKEHWGKRMAQLTQPPLWADRAEIANVYALAVAMTTLLGEPYEVDHIIPLRGRKACGLHVVENLQVITKVENGRKGNRMPI